MNNKRRCNIFDVYVRYLLRIISKSPYSRLLIAITIAFGCGVGYGFNSSFLADQGILRTPAISTKRSFNRAEYERLKVGMELFEVEAILGRGTEIAQSTKSKTFIWENFDKSKIIIIFEDNKLIKKQQIAL